MALTLSAAVEKTRKLAHGRRYALAAHRALQSMGFSSPRTVKVGPARIVNDIGADESVSVLTAVTSFLGKEGSRAKAQAGHQTWLNLA